MERLYDEEDDTSRLRKPSNLLYSRLPRKLRKALISAFSVNSKESKSSKLSAAIGIAVAAVSMMQGISLLLPHPDSISTYDSMSNVFAFINYQRIDTLAFDLGRLYELFYVLLAAIYTPLLILIGNTGAHMYCKRKPHWASVKLMTVMLSAIEQVLMIPALIVMCAVIKYTYLLQTQTMYEYIDSRAVVSGPYLAAVSIVTLPLLVALLYMHSYFCFENEFSRRRSNLQSMRDSQCHRLSLVSRLSISLSYSFLSPFSHTWDKVAILCICVFMLSSQLARMCFYNHFANVVSASKSAVWAWAAVATFVGIVVDSATATFTMVAFVSPVLVLLVYCKATDRLQSIRKQRLEDINVSYQIELKLRSYLESLETRQKTEHDGIHARVERLFHYATRQFAKDAQVALWESQYYDFYRKDPLTALLKLSKSHIAETTLESQYFIRKAEIRLRAAAKSQEREYLSYLKRVDQVKKADETCCLLLIALCSELLGHRIDARKFEKGVQRLSTEIDKTQEQYCRLLKQHEDSEELLRLQGSFMVDILRSDEGRHVLTKAGLMRQSELRRSASTSLYSEQNGLIMISCCLDSLGEVLLANAKALETLNCGRVDLLHKSIAQFLPSEMQALFEQTVKQSVLFGTYADTIHRLFGVLMDTDGYLVPATATFKLTTLDCEPHGLLRLSPRHRCDCILIDPQYAVKAHTHLSLATTSENASYAGSHLSVISDPLYRHLSAGESEDFQMQDTDGTSYYVTTHDVSFRSVQWSLVSLLPILRSSRRSTITSQVARQNRGTNKGVRFTAEELFTSSMGVEEPLRVSAEVVVDKKQKMEIITSVATSATSSTNFEMQQSARISKSLRRVRLFLLFSFLLLITGLVISVVFILSILDSLKSISTLRNLSESNRELLEAAYSVRSLMFTDTHEGLYDIDTVTMSLEQSVLLLEKSIVQMKALVGDGSREVDAFFTKQKVPMWYKLETTFSFRMLSLIDALYEYTAAASRFAASSSPYSASSDCYFLFRNGVSDLPDLANHTLDVRVRDEGDIRAQKLGVIVVLLYLCGALAILPLCMLVAPQFLLFERESRKIWSDMYKLPKEAIITVRNAAEERLQQYFNSDEIIENAPLSKHSDSRVKPTRLWPAFTMKLSVYLVLNLALLVTVGVVYYKPLEELALTIPNYMFWIGMRPGLITQGMLWMREYLHGKEEYRSLVSSGQERYAEAERIQNATATITFLNSLLYFGNPAFGINQVKKSHQYVDFVLDESCSALSLPGCSDTVLAIGLTPAIKDWNQLLKHELMNHRSDETVKTQLPLLEAQRQRLHIATEHAINMYQSDAITQIDEISVQTVVLTAVFICLIAAMYLVFYSQALNSLKRKARQALNIHRILGAK